MHDSRLYKSASPSSLPQQQQQQGHDFCNCTTLPLPPALPSLRFVEGSIRAPTGPEWDVVCPRFMLEVPQYMF